MSPLTSPPPADDHPPGGHAARVARAVELLARGELVSLTLSQSFRRACEASAADAFGRLRAVNPAPAAFFLNDGLGGRLFGASPDLQLAIDGRDLLTLPVCGTEARRPEPVGESLAVQALMAEAVDAASLAVCTDALHQDLAPLCEPGSLRLTHRRAPMSLATVVHTVDAVSGRLRAGADAWDAIVATAAPPMATGAPRAAALAAIDTLEASPRGWYGGLALCVRPDGQTRVGTVLRAAWLHDGVAEVRTGGDILADSDPAREEAESRLKARSLWRALGLSDEGLPRPATARDDASAAHAPGPALASIPAPALLRVRLVDAGDPLIAGLRDALLAVGAQIDGADAPAPAQGEQDGAVVTVIAGRHVPAVFAALAAAAGRGLPVLAVGDAATCLLAGHAPLVVAAPPRQGRVEWARADAAAPWRGAAAVGAGFAAPVYATLALAQAPLDRDWIVWARSEDGAPLALARGGAAPTGGKKAPAVAPSRAAALCWRPDSLLAGDAGRDALAGSLRWLLSF